MKHLEIDAVEVSIQNNELESAMGALESYVRINANPTPILIYYSDKFRALSQWNHSRTIEEWLIAENPEDSRGYIRIASSLAKANNFLKANSYADLAVNFARQSTISIGEQRLFAYTLIELGRDDDALILLKDLIKRDPGNPEYTILYAQVKVRLNLIGDAILLLTTRSERGAQFALAGLLANSNLEDYQFTFILDSLLKADCSIIDRKHPPVLAISLFKLSFTSPEVHERILKYLQDNIEKLGVYMLASIGRLEDPADLIASAIHNGQLDLLQYLVSNHPLHAGNLSLAKRILATSSQPVTSTLCMHLSNMFNPPAIIGSQLTKELRIAVCVSGQLRNYKVAFPTWDHIFIAPHQYDFFCAAWDKIGNKALVPQHAARLLPKNLIPLFQDLWHSSDNPTQQYKQFFQLFDQDLVVSPLHISDFYSASNVEVVKTSDYLGKSNPYCMHLMIEKCFDLIPNPYDYDLVVRIRPDKAIASSAIRWESIYETCRRSDTLFCDNGYAASSSSIHPIAGIVIGDQMAISSPAIMEQYSHTFSKAHANKLPLTGPDLKPHSSLAESIAQCGIQTASLEDNISFMPLEATFPVGETVIIEALRKCPIPAQILAKYSNVFSACD